MKTKCQHIVGSFGHSQTVEYLHEGAAGLHSMKPSVAEHLHTSRESSWLFDTTNRHCHDPSCKAR